MSKLYFKFGAMASSKTANALMTRFNYEEKGNRVWLIKPDIDNRDDYLDENGNRVTVVKSRIGLSAVADVIPHDANLLEMFEKTSSERAVDVIICDECQFLTAAQVDQMKYIAEFCNTPVLCFGLRSDFQTKLFEGSTRLFEIADSITEVKSVCKCGKKAIVNARVNENGKIVTEGAQIEIGGNDKYESMCWGCWQTRIAEEKDLRS
ncbi:MAG: thymidine kinase [Clostridia bacterium]|nr:thymidine kinase [Clostridia bacterium]